MNNKAKKTILAAVLTLAIYTALYLLSKTILADVYLFAWTAWNKYLYFWLVSLAFIIFQKYFIAFYITIGNIIAVLFGELLGDLIIYINTFRITPDMQPYTIERYTTHYGAFIWLALVLLALIIGVRREFPKK